MAEATGASEGVPSPPAAGMSAARRWVMVLGVAAAVILADQLTKRWALDRLSGGEMIDLIGSLRFRLAFNTGMAFSKGSGSGALIGVVALGIVGVLAFVARRVQSRVATGAHRHRHGRCARQHRGPADPRG